MEYASDGSEQRVLPAAGQQRHAERRAVRPHRGGEGEPAQFEQVDEVRIGAEPAVELDRVGEHLLDRIGGRHGRQHQRVDVAEDVVANPAQVFELVESCERVDRGRPCATENDLAGDRMHRLRCRRDQGAGDDVALGHPRPFVQQPCGLVERLDVDGDNLGAEPREPFDRIIVVRGRYSIAEEQPLARQRHGELQVRRETHPAFRAAARENRHRPDRDRPSRQGRRTHRRP